MSSVPQMAARRSGGVMKLYDLPDPEAWERAGRERAAWGRERSAIYCLDNDHIVIEFKPGGALEAAS